MFTRLASCILLGAACAPGDAPPVSVFSSTSGKWVLSVSRSDRTWNGDVDLVLTHDGVEAWSAEHELGLRHACVSDDGLVAGYGYTGRHGGVIEGFNDEPARGEILRIFVFDREGGLALDESHPRKPSRYLDHPGDPVAGSAFLIPSLRRFVVRVPDEDINRGAESWWVYDLEGNPLFSERPKLALGHEYFVQTLLTAEPIPGTPLVLLHWLTYDDRLHAYGSIFQLVDADIRPVWTIGLPYDLHALAPSAIEKIRVRGSVVATSEMAFVLRLNRVSSLVSYGVDREGDAWRVTETARVGDEVFLDEPPPPRRMPSPH